MGKKSRSKKLRKTMPGGETVIPVSQTIIWSPGAQKVVALALLCVLLLTSIVLRFSNLDVQGRSPDESICTAQARVIAQDGIPSLSMDKCWLG